MDQEKKEIVLSVFNRTNIITVVKSIFFTAILIIGVISSLFWGMALYDQWTDRQIYINNFGTGEDRTKIYLCTVKEEKLCSRKELIDENIFMTKLIVRNYFYFSYLPGQKGQNIVMMLLNLAVIAKIFSKIKNKQGEKV